MAGGSTPAWAICLGARTTTRRCNAATFSAAKVNGTKWPTCHFHDRYRHFLRLILINLAPKITFHECILSVSQLSKLINKLNSCKDLHSLHPHKGVDLWNTDQPAYGQNGTYGAYIYNREIQRVLSDRHSRGTKAPMFLYVALQVSE